MVPWQKSYTAGFKFMVNERTEKIGKRAARCEYQIDERCIRRWKLEKVYFQHSEEEASLKNWCCGMVQFRG